jgi:hypothetical protein
MTHYLALSRATQPLRRSPYYWVPAAVCCFPRRLWLSPRYGVFPATEFKHVAPPSCAQTSRVQQPTTEITIKPLAFDAVLERGGLVGLLLAPPDYSYSSPTSSQHHNTFCTLTELLLPQMTISNSANRMLSEAPCVIILLLSKVSGWEMFSFLRHGRA